MPQSPKTNLHHFYWQSAFNLLGNATASFLAFLFNYLVIKKITAGDYGEYASAMAYVTLCTLPLTVISLLVTKKISSRAIDRRWSYLQTLNRRTLTTLQKYWYLLAAVGLALVGWLFWQANFFNLWSIPVTLVAIVFTSVTTFLLAEFSGLQWFALLSLTSIISMALRLASGLVGLTISPTLTSAYICVTVALFLQMICHYFMLRHKGKKPLTVTGQSEQPYTFSSIWQSPDLRATLLSTLITTALINLDVIVVKMVCPPEAAGFYGLMSLMAKIIYYASQPLVNVAFTFFNSSQDRPTKNRIFLISFALITFFAGGMSVIYYLIPEWLIRIVGTADYLSLAPSLWLAAVFGGIFCLSLLIAQYLVASNRRELSWGLIVPVAQVIGIVLWHQTVSQIMLVNIVVTTVLLGLLLVIKSRSDHAQTSV